MEEKEMRFCVWSNEHRAWWRPKSCGYTVDREKAGEYTLKRAKEICDGANRGITDNKTPDEIIVRIK